MSDVKTIKVPKDVSELYVSGTGHLCCQQPRKMVLSEEPVGSYEFSHMDYDSLGIYAVLEPINGSIGVNRKTVKAKSSKLSNSEISEDIMERYNTSFERLAEDKEN